MTQRLNGYGRHAQSRSKPPEQKFCVNCEHHTLTRSMSTGESAAWCMHPLSANQSPTYLVDGVSMPYRCIEMRQSGRCGVHGQLFQPKTQETDQ